MNWTLKWLRMDSKTGSQKNVSAQLGFVVNILDVMSRCVIIKGSISFLEYYTLQRVEQKERKTEESLQSMKTVVPAKSNSCQASTSQDSFSFHSHRKKLEPIMCFPYPHAAQTINGWDTLTATFQGRRTHRQTDGQTDGQTRQERHQVGTGTALKPPGRLPSAARREDGVNGSPRLHVIRPQEEEARSRRGRLAQ